MAYILQGSVKAATESSYSRPAGCSEPPGPRCGGLLIVRGCCTAVALMAAVSLEVGDVTDVVSFGFHRESRLPLPN